MAARFVSFTAHVITVSTRAAAGVWEDRSGPILVSGLEALGFVVTGPQVVSDGDPVEAALRTALGVDLILTTGGTGLTPTDRTPEATSKVIDREVPGIAEAIRAFGVATGSTLVINVPGSPGGAKDALTVLGPVLMHAVEQIGGSDHSR